MIPHVMLPNEEQYDSHNPEFLAALGELTIDFSTLEEVLREII